MTVHDFWWQIVYDQRRRVATGGNWWWQMTVGHDGTVRRWYETVQRGSSTFVEDRNMAVFEIDQISYLLTSLSPGFWHRINNLFGTLVSSPKFEPTQSNVSIIPTFSWPSLSLSKLPNNRSKFNTYQAADNTLRCNSIGSSFFIIKKTAATRIGRAVCWWSCATIPCALRLLTVRHCRGFVVHDLGLFMFKIIEDIRVEMDMFGLKMTRKWSASSWKLWVAFRIS